MRLQLSLGLWIALAPAVSAQLEPLFRPTHFDAGAAVKHVSIGDVDSDGKLDLVLATDGDTRVMLGDGTLAFGAPSVLVGPAAAQVLLDLNGDGHPDLAQARWAFGEASGVNVRLGYGTGGFQPELNNPVDGGPNRLAAADIDADGAWDFVTLSATNAPSASQRGSVLLGHGDGNFDPAVHFAPVSKVDGFVAAGDLDGDGDDDVVVTSAAGHYERVFLSLGNGSFAAPLTQAMASSRSCALGDYDGDGTLDLATDRIPDLAFRHGLGNGNFGAAVTLNYSPSFELWATDFVTTDLDEDGFDDLLFSIGTPLSVATMTSGVGFVRGAPGLALAPVQFFAANDDCQELGVADLNGDGDLDVAVADARSKTVSILSGDGDGTLRPGWRIGTGTGQVLAADVNEDGLPDLLSASYSDTDMALLTALGNGRFSTATLVAVGRPTEGLGAADLDGDGHLDALQACSPFIVPGGFYALLGDGAGGFSAPVVSALTPEVNGLAIADLDEDGTLDAATYASFDAELHIGLGNGDGSFTLLPAFAATVAAGSGHPLEALDATEDGHVDLLLPDVNGFNSTGRVATLPGLGDGRFLAPLFSATGQWVEALATGDLNGDGHADVVTCAYFFDLAAVRLGDGAGHFGPETPLITGDGPARPLIVDLDGDGKADVVLAEGPNEAGDVAFHAGHGDGTLAPRVAFTTAAAASDVAVADLDLDGHLDLAVACAGPGSVEVLPNQRGPWNELGHPLAGTLGLPRMFATGTLAPGSTVAFELRDARPNALTSLIGSAQLLNAPFKGGTLVPAFGVFLYPLPTDAQGGFAFSGTLPPIGSGTSFYVQFWTPDPAGIKGFSASGAMSGTTP